MNLRLFLDANILFTAAYSPGGLSALLFELRRLRVLELLTSERAAAEARVNLQLKRPEALASFEKLMKPVQLVPTPAQNPVDLSLPDDDSAIFAAALAARATHFITGDAQHFGRYFNKSSETAGICVQTARQFFDDRF